MLIFIHGMHPLPIQKWNEVLNVLEEHLLGRFRKLILEGRLCRGVGFREFGVGGREIALLQFKETKKVLRVQYELGS